MNAAKSVIEKFGGQSSLAALIGKGQSTVAHWAKTGVVPAKWHPTLLQLAAEKGIDLVPSDFLSPLKTAELMPAETNEFPKATHWGDLDIAGTTIPCYVLNTGDRVFSLKGVVVGLIGTEGGQLAEYLKVKALQPHLPIDLIPSVNGDIPALFRFDAGGEGIGKYAIGIKVERFNAQAPSGEGEREAGAGLGGGGVEGGKWASCQYCGFPNLFSFPVRPGDWDEGLGDMRFRLCFWCGRMPTHDQKRDEPPSPTKPESA